jgi:hypothetical protein
LTVSLSFPVKVFFETIALMNKLRLKLYKIRYGTLMLSLKLHKMRSKILKRV